MSRLSKLLNEQGKDFTLEQMGASCGEVLAVAGLARGNRQASLCFVLLCAPARLAWRSPDAQCVHSGCPSGFWNTSSCYSCSALWSTCPSLGCRPPRCSAAAGRHTPRWHREAHSPQPHRRGCGLSSWDGTSPSDWQWGRTLLPHSGNHLHKNLLLKLKQMRPRV